MAARLGVSAARGAAVALRDTPCPTSGAAAVLRWTGCEEILHIQGQRNPSETGGAGAAVRRYPTSKGKGEAPARWYEGQIHV